MANISIYIEGVISYKPSYIQGGTTLRLVVNRGIGAMVVSSLLHSFFSDMGEV